MATEEHEQQNRKSKDEDQERKTFPWWRLTIALIFIIGFFLGFLFLSLCVVWVLSKLGIVPPSWSKIVAPVFSFVGLIVGCIFNKDFFQELFKVTTQVPLNLGDAWVRGDSILNRIA